MRFFYFLSNKTINLPSPFQNSGDSKFSHFGVIKNVTFFIHNFKNMEAFSMQHQSFTSDKHFDGGLCDGFNVFTSKYPIGFELIFAFGGLIVKPVRHKWRAAEAILSQSQLHNSSISKTFFV